MRLHTTLLLFFFSILNLFSQTGKELLVLDNYTIPTGIEGVVVGRMVVSPEDVIFLDKDTSELFIFDKLNYIRLKNGVSLSDCHAERFGVDFQYGEEVKSFELVKDDFERNGVIAHMGAWKNTTAERNTLDALKEAVNIGCEASRCDVRLTSDNRVVLFSDVEANDRFVENISSSELSRTESGISYLEECLEYIKTQNKTRLHINLRTMATRKDRALALADSVVQMVHRLNAQAWVEYTSFDYDVLLHVRQLDQTALLSYLGNDKDFGELADDNISAIDCNFNIYMKNPELFEKSQDFGLTMKVWTVSNEKNMIYFLENGIHYITTDEPEKLLWLVAE